MEGGTEDVARVKTGRKQWEAWSLYSGNVPASGIYLQVFSAAPEGGKINSNPSRLPGGRWPWVWIGRIIYLLCHFEAF